MNDARNPLVRLQDLQHFLADGTLEDNLHQQAAMTSALLGAASCSIMLLGGGDGDEMRMSVYARHGELPEAARQASVARGEGIAGRVLASGESLLIEDIAKSELASLARHPEAGCSLLCVPIRIDGKIVGVINAASCPGNAPFGETELRLLEVAALFIGKAIQVQQLQHLLDSRFAQLALLQEAQQKVGESVRTAYRNPEDVAKILARSFFREMTKAGFESAQIVSAASELIGQLNLHLHEKGQTGASRVES
ncbi:GAF domain-containing protein [Massilia sp. YIM B02763]|uniref:GAF domain-containing protein n=1 Tax=Massilia sp. YIM B02763 TaxID=3050130 RepID=UPI0025B6F541|nr:GAF domain-containing protein [Massilia sp. YIM B02763]MDN4053726.1 GAF domain-containing protein [Massilia sp. YIM B02763]